MSSQPLGVSMFVGSLPPSAGSVLPPLQPTTEAVANKAAPSVGAALHGKRLASRRTTIELPFEHDDLATVCLG